MVATSRLVAVGGTVLLVAGWVGSARAEGHTLNAVRQAVISNAEGDARILVQFEGAERVSGRLVTSAFLTASIPERMPSRSLDVAVHALDTRWVDRSPTWEWPWRQPGGDVAASFPSNSFEVGEAASGIRINVTSAVQEMSEGRAADFGFMLTPAAWDREGFTVEDRVFLGALSGLRLEVTTANARAGGAVGREIVAAARGEGVAEPR